MYCFCDNTINMTVAPNMHLLNWETKPIVILGFGTDSICKDIHIFKVLDLVQSLRELFIKVVCILKPCNARADLTS